MNFSQKVYRLAKEIPKGKVATYKSIAEKLGTKAYRAVGQALKRNKNTGGVPCFRVVKSNGEAGGYCGSDKRNIRKKIKKLRAEGVEIKDNKIVNLKKYLYQFHKP